MALDALYGNGTSAAFASAVTVAGWPAPEIEEIALEGGNVRVNIAWGAAEMKFECSPDNVHFLSLLSGKTLPAGLYTALAIPIPPFFKARGVRTFSCSPRDAASTTVLKKRGAWRDEPRGLRWEL